MQGGVGASFRELQQTAAPSGVRRDLGEILTEVAEGTAELIYLG
ncbi:MAG TPA: hypothetical protein VK988_02280 [Acidimicrobiales bacterium]|nr:hypothetical protein [Acidimicrobiales bacterium]